MVGCLTRNKHVMSLTIYWMEKLSIWVNSFEIMLYNVNSYSISLYQAYPTKYRMHAGLDNTTERFRNLGYPNWFISQVQHIYLHSKYSNYRKFCYQYIFTHRTYISIPYRKIHFWCAITHRSIWVLNIGLILYHAWTENTKLNNFSIITEVQNYLLFSSGFSICFPAHLNKNQIKIIQQFIPFKHWNFTHFYKWTTFYIFDYTDICEIQRTF